MHNYERAGILMQGKHKGPSTELATPLVGSPHPPDPHLLRQARAEVRGTISSLKASYGIRVDMRGHNQTDAQDLTHLEKLTLVEAAASLRTVRQELAKYPQDFSYLLPAPTAAAGPHLLRSRTLPSARSRLRRQNLP
jgi:hypothetical protein